MKGLHAIAQQLRDAADELDRNSARSTFESLWAKHLREDSKSLYLLAEARDRETVST